MFENVRGKKTEVVGRRREIHLPDNILSHTRPAIPGGLRSRIERASYHLGFHLIQGRKLSKNPEGFRIQTLCY